MLVLDFDDPDVGAGVGLDGPGVGSLECIRGHHQLSM